MKLTKRINALQPSATMAVIEAAARLRAEGIDIISFGAGEPDFNTPDHIIKAAHQAMAEGKTRYTPGSGTISLRRAIASKLKRDNNLVYDPGQIVVSNGGKHSLFNICMTLFEEGDEVLILAPYWVTFPELVRVSDATPVVVETCTEDHFQITEDQLAKAVTGNTRGMIINSPSNPSGAVLNRQSLEAIVAVAKAHDLWIIADECYDGLVYDGESISLATLDGAYERTITVQTMSKAFAMTGWRIGYAAAPFELAEAMGKFQGQATSCPNSIAQYASEIALTSNREFLQHWREEFIQRRNYMVDALNAMEDISCLMPEGAFYAFPKVSALYGRSVDGKTITNSTEFTEFLLDKANITVVPGVAFGADEHIRLSYATSMDAIKTGLERFSQAVKSLS